MTAVGVLFTGALGYVAAATTAGVVALRGGEPRRGMVSDLEDFASLPMCNPSALVFGGWDIRSGSPCETARSLFARNLAIDPVAAEAPPERWAEVTEAVRPGCALNCGPAVESLTEPGFPVLRQALAGIVSHLRADIRDFRRRHEVERVVVVHLASTELPLASPGLTTAAEVEDGICQNRRHRFRAGTLYAYAAIHEGCPFINFTPSDSCLPPGIVELARQYGVPVMGNDGKTGETLIKSVLAPLFRCRNLEVLGWEGVNLLGNGDGAVLDDPRHGAAKLRSKADLLPALLGYAPSSQVRIDLFPSLDDRKVAWDFIHFRGFLGAQMSLQFTWQGHDSFLAAPLVIDLIRFADLAARRGEAGLLPHLASFFKAPLGVSEHRFYEQFRLLQEYAARVIAEPPARPAGEPRNAVAIH